MGKWIATDHYLDGRWMIMKEGGKDVGSMSKDQATRYALALNIADAGVDLGEAKVLMEELRKAANSTDQYLCDKHIYGFIRSIANAVKGDTTKEESNG